MKSVKQFAALVIASLLLLSLIACSSKEKSDFSFKENDSTLALYESGNLVFNYQKTPKSLNGKFARNNYLHPLMSVNGDTLTEDFPEDHPHQRGVFWAWHQIYVDTTHVSDSWALIDFASPLQNIETVIQGDSAVLNLDLFWTSPKYKNGKPYLEEKTTITTHKTVNGTRKIDFKIALQALVNGVKIGGSDNEKGYGGFSIRIKMPDELKFYSEQGEVTPQRLQIKAGPWLKFTAPFGKHGWTDLILRTLPQSPNYPQPWILRQKSSMQNAVFPGKDLVEITKEKPLVLYYTLEIKNKKN